MTPLKTQDVQMLGIGLGKSIYSPEQIEEFIRFQESQGTRRAFLAESAERAYNSRFGGEWGSGLTDLATDHLVDVVGFHLVPLYRLLGPTAIIAILVLFSSWVSSGCCPTSSSGRSPSLESGDAGCGC